MFKADNWIASGSGYVDTCQRKRFLCHREMNRDRWLYLAKECSVCKELNFADDPSGSEVPPLHFGDYIKYLCCKASGSMTAWPNSLFFSLSPFSSASLSLSFCPVIWARTRFRGFQGKPSGELWRSRTCKWHFGDTFCVRERGACVCVHVCHPLFSVFANVHNPQCACASIFHCVKCHVPPACCIDRCCYSLVAVCVCVCVCAMDVMWHFCCFLSLFCLRHSYDDWR